ncbi:MAG: HD domain-containing phosphohydrolase [Actinomycetota bacterium]
MADGDNRYDARILVVDDEAPVLRLLTRLLEQNGYSCATAGDALEATAVLDAERFDLLLTDMNLPGESGLDLIRAASDSYPDLATVMVTGLDDRTLANAALELGAYGYIIKPFESNEILISVTNALRRRALEIENRGHQARLEQQIRERTAELWNAIRHLETTQEELRRSREETVKRLSIAAEFRDDETGRHIQRMSRYCALLARELGVDSERGELIRVASQMHDIGKLGIPDSILRKPGPLTPEERRVMERHCEIGWRILSESQSELLDFAATIARTHHERVDGTGYPHGLSGSDIPFEGRVAAIADVFDALTTDRIYRAAMPLGRALEIMREGRGTHFDAAALDGFFDALDGVIRIHEELSDD